MKSYRNEILIHENFLTATIISLVNCCVYPYRYIDDWKKINKTLPEQGDSYNHLNMEDITYADDLWDFL